MKILLIDNYDSFTYNLAHYCQALGAQVHTYLHDAIDLEAIEQLHPTHIILSPGPGRPEEAGITLSAIKHLHRRYPILGVCLGHQALALAFGAQIRPALDIVHGKTSAVFHRCSGLFQDIPSPLFATRYHSLAIDAATLPQDWHITAWTEDHEVMAIAHHSLPLYGVQFHPESITSEYGPQILSSFLYSTMPTPPKKIRKIPYDLHY